MADTSILCSSVMKHTFLLYVYILLYFVGYSSQDDGVSQNNSYLISSFTYAKTVLKPYDWRYIRGTLFDSCAFLSLKLVNLIFLCFLRFMRF